MELGMYQSAAALNAYSQWQNNVAHKLANSNTDGFKARNFGMEMERLGHRPATTLNEPGALVTLNPGYSPEATDQANFAQGAHRQTGNPLNVAIDGEGFFEIDAQNGGVLYTRDGNFQLNPNYELTDSQGRLVRGEGGATITIDPDLGELYISPSGQVFQGDEEAGRIAVTRFETPQLLQHASGGFIDPEGEAGAQAANEALTRLNQGFLEGSNVNAVREMVNMVTLSRAYEMNTRIVQAYDARFAQAINQLGNDASE